MTSPADPTEPLDKAVRQRRLRRAQAESEGRQSIGRHLALIGVVGWTIALPTLAGMFLGRWLDRVFATQSGIFWTLGLLVAGLAAGCALAWKRINRE